MSLLARMGRPLPAETGFVDGSDLAASAQGVVGRAFRGGRARDTVALWGAFFLCLLAVYSAFGWLPTMLSAQGLDVGMAGAGLTAYNLGGALGSLVCAGAITRLGSLQPLVVCAILASVSAFALNFVDIADTVVLIVGLGIHGFFVNAVQSTLYAVAAYVYPTAIRATGTRLRPVLRAARRRAERRGRRGLHLGRRPRQLSRRARLLRCSAQHSSCCCSATISRRRALPSEAARRQRFA